MGGLSNIPPPATIGSKLAELLGVRVHKRVEIRVGDQVIAGDMRVLSRAENADVDRGAREVIAKLEVGPLVPLSFSEWNAENAVRTLATAIRDVDNHEVPLDTLAAWRELVTDEQVGQLYEQYKDLVDELDPIGSDVVLTKDELGAMREAVKKRM